MNKETFIKELEKDISLNKSAEEIYVKYIQPVAKMSQKRDLLLEIIKKTKDINYLIKLNEGEE